jgi:hypothetical protein
MTKTVTMPRKQTEPTRPTWIPDSHLFLRDAVDRFEREVNPDTWTGEETNSETVIPSDPRSRLDEAYAALRQLFYKETITTVLFTDAGVTIPLPGERWGEENAQDIFAMERIQITENTRQFYEYGDFIKGWVLVSKPELEEAIEYSDLDGEKATKEENSAPEKNKGGAPRKWDWDGCYREAIRIANTPDGLPEVQAELFGMLDQWFINEYKKSPAPSTLNAQIQKIYEQIYKSEN